MSVQLFKWLMALVVMVCIPWLLESFRNLRNTDFKLSEEHLRQRVQTIYAKVTLFYNRLYTLRQEGEAGPTQWPDFDRLYCSDDWNRQLADVARVDSTDTDEDFFTWNYWTCAEGIDFVYYSDVEVIDKTGRQATVSLRMHSGDRAVPVLLNMVYERGEWFIDEMTCNWLRQPGIPYREWKQEMKVYSTGKTVLNESKNFTNERTSL
jgi:hypothetical protein